MTGGATGLFHRLSYLNQQRSFVWGVDGSDNLFLSGWNGAVSAFPLFIFNQAPNNSLILGATNVTIRKPKLTDLPSSATGLASGEVYRSGSQLMGVP
jgi:hypothetical protein